MENNYVTCDNCNIEANPRKTVFVKNSPDSPEGQLTIRGSFQGDLVAALAAGWKEVNYGHLCPTCTVELQYLEDSGDTVIGLAALGEKMVNG
jgi:hypothetical protein